MKHCARRWILDGLTAIVCIFILSHAFPTPRRDLSQYEQGYDEYEGDDDDDDDELLTTQTSPENHRNKAREIGEQSSEVRQERDETISRLIAQDHQSRGGRKEGAPALREDVAQHVHHRPQQSLHGQQFKEHLSSSQYYHRKAAPLRPVKPDAGVVSGASEDVSPLLVSRPGGCVPLWTCYCTRDSSRLYAM